MNAPGRTSRFFHCARNLMLASALVLTGTSAAAAGGAQRPEVLVDIGFGPAGLLVFGPVFQDQPLHGGLKLSVEAIVNQAAIRKNLRRVPKQYRKTASQMKEFRMKPLWFLPDTLIISPPVRGTGMYGITFNPIGIGVAAGSGARVSLGADLALTYAYLFSDRLPSMHFIRPGVAVEAELELAPVKSFAISTGWQSTFYIPQEMGSFGVGTLDNSIWHIGQVFLKFHIRTPYKGRI